MTNDSLNLEISELKKKLEENPDSLVFAPLSDAFRRQGNLKEALEVCKKGLQKHPSYTLAQVVLGRILREQGKINEAADEFKTVLEIDPDNLLAHNLLGSIYLEKKDFQAAIEEYQKVLTLNPDDEEAQKELKVAIEKAAGENQGIQAGSKSENLSNRKVSSQKESTATLTLADLYLKQGHFDKAIEVFQELLANDPQNLMLRQKLTETVERQQKESAVTPAHSKLKKNVFTQPPDQKEDVLVEETKIDVKKSPKLKEEDDSKFTNEDILLVMRRGGKDDAVVEDKKSSTASVASEPVKTPSHSTTNIASAADGHPSSGWTLDEAKKNALKGALGELAPVEGIIKGFWVGPDGKILVASTEADYQSEASKQAFSILKSTRQAVDAIQNGKLQQIMVTAENGHILLVYFNGPTLVVLANGKANLGLLRFSLDSLVKKVEKNI
jgi:pentatricopeptide repeat protein